MRRKFQGECRFSLPRIYITDPFFRRVQDVLRLLAIPGTPMARAMGTTTPMALANKVAPLLGTGRDLATGQQYLTPEGGPPIVGPGSDFTDGLVQSAAFLANQLQPAQVNARMASKDAEGMKLPQPRLSVRGPAGVGYTAGEGVQSPASLADAASGAASVLTNVRQSAGPRYTSPQAFYEGQRLNAFGPELTKLYVDSGVGLQTATTTLRSNGRVMDMTAKERQTYNAFKADALQRALAHTSLPDEPASRKAVLRKAEKQADGEATQKTVMSVGNADFMRRARVERTGLSNADVPALLDRYAGVYTGR